MIYIIKVNDGRRLSGKSWVINAFDVDFGSCGVRLYRKNIPGFGTRDIYIKTKKS